MIKILTPQDSDFFPQWNKLLAFQESISPVYSELFYDYQKAYLESTPFTDHSFLIDQEGTPVAGMRLTERTRETVIEASNHALPILYLENPNALASWRDNAASAIKERVASLLTERKWNYVRFQERTQTLSSFGTYLLGMGAKASPRYTQLIDLKASVDELYQDVRRRYKPLINWGKKNLKTQILTAETIRDDDIHAFRKLHQDVAGRVTRSEVTWILQCQMVKAREAFCVFSYLDDALVSANLFHYNSTCCYYAIGASRRDLFEKPISHVGHWLAINHAKELGLKHFEMGEIFFAVGEPGPTEKDLSIANFKLGFGGNTHIKTDIYWESAPVHLAERNLF